MNLYRSYEVDEETPVQFAGVYVTRGRPEWGEPTILFREIEDDELDALATKSARVQALALISRECLALMRLRMEQDAGLGRDRVMERACDVLESTLNPFEAADV